MKISKDDKSKFQVMMEHIKVGDILRTKSKPITTYRVSNLSPPTITNIESLRTFELWNCMWVRDINGIEFNEWLEQIKNLPGKDKEIRPENKPFTKLVYFE